MSPKRARRWQSLRWFAALAYTVGLFTMGMIDIGPLPVRPSLPIDKVGHLAAFGAYVWVMELALLELSPRARRFLAVAASLTAGLLLELVQSALPHRSADAWDFTADALGALLAAFLSFAASRVWQRSAPAAPRET
jgi:VanZ family protein